MRAARLHTIGGSLQLDTIDDPEANDGEVVVDMAYASVNPLDVWVTQGSVGAASANLPWIPGTEGTGFLDGQPVLVRGGGIGVLRPGVYAERAVVPQAAITPLRADRHMAQIAALGVAGVTAWNAVHVHGKITADDRVVVLGASGGVGSLAVQLAKATGATVWGQSSNADKVGNVLSDGADHVVVGDHVGLAEKMSELSPTVILDALGGAYSPAAINALVAGGRLIVYGTSAGEMVELNMRTLYRKGLTVSGYTGLIEPPAQAAKVMSDLLIMVDEGSIRIGVEEVGLGDAAEAHRRILERRVVGKLVLDVSR